jgi:MOSC domain-containing protein YiiM
MDPAPTIVMVSCGPDHGVDKPNRDCIRLLEGLGVEGDAHAGATVQHLSRLARDPSAPNLRQVHLIHSELFDELRTAGFHLRSGQMGENVTTRGLDLLGLPEGARLRLGENAIVEVTGLRNPCRQLDGIQPGLMAASLQPERNGKRLGKAGVMAIVVAGGEVRPGDSIRIELPARAHAPLRPV